MLDPDYYWEPERASSRSTRGPCPISCELDYPAGGHPDDRAGRSRVWAHNVPPAPQRKFNKTIDLENLQGLADALVRSQIPNDPQRSSRQDLMLLRQASCGGRSLLSAVGAWTMSGLWVAKFNRDARPLEAILGSSTPYAAAGSRMRN